MKTLLNLQTLCYSLSQSMDSSEVNAKLSLFKDQIEDEIQYIAENKQKVRELLGILFPQGISDSNSFYKVLSNVPHCLGFVESSYQLMGMFWSQAYRQLPPNCKEDFLDYWVDNDEFQFWSYILALQSFLLNVEVPSTYTSKWFLKIGNVVRDDLAGGNFYRAIEIYVFKSPASGLDIFDQYVSTELDELKLHIAAIILGVLRSKSIQDKSFEKEVNKRDVSLKSSPKLQLRLCNLRSWSFAFCRGGVSMEKMRLVLDLAMERSAAEQDEAFAAVYRCLNGQVKENVVQFTLQWLNRYASPGLSSNAKRSVLKIISRLQECQEAGRQILETPRTNSFILAIQPIDVKDVEIWKEVESFLVTQLHKSIGNFKELLIQITEITPKSFIEQFKNRVFSLLISEMGKVDVQGLVSDCLFSEREQVRRLGSMLFQRIRIDDFPDDVMKGRSDTELNPVLWEFVRGTFDGESSARFLLLLEPLFRNASDCALLDDFEQEMVLQAINFPGACLEKWKKFENPSDLLNRVIANAENYFELLQSVKDSPAYSFQFPGLREADEIGRRDMSKNISESVRKQSLFEQLSKRVSLLYGDSWCMLGQGDQRGIGETLPLHDFSSVMEVPRLEILAPEMMALRRLEASVKLQDLNQGGSQRV